ncbi:LysM peptidoglycan-binding domain-containing protein [Tropicibacter naphthalenivorans]|uniref:LysM domain/BON superfamily protein n=1 Tax=Tropicibacter naphthalenivorans TaxID=441103 RepID=A0A0P1G304_9RHOB|nr:transporter substrate-binding domain-containing protein [Tropicibacter naphthalenivorans]CUH76061.1 LysM domain/BON superfamily protein [Tropicibacter naphthalenivorans]SMC40262.1 amino acid ABC transporter substrate-binding protein, PAAT family [Tropicibacter naphthalenivorans]
MTTRTVALAAAMLAAGTVSVAAQETCGGFYKVRPGDSLSLIADKLYKDVGQWTAIYRSNIDKISAPDAIRVGQSYRMPCINGLPTGLKGGTPVEKIEALAAEPAPQVDTRTAQVQREKAAEARQQGVDVKLLASDDFRPFTNRMQMSSGLITDLVNRAFVANEDTGAHKFYWVNDRAAHLDPMLSEGMVDMAFPWKKPDCEADAGNALCTDYIYSEPMFEMLVVLFTAKGSGVKYAGEADLAGLRVCAPIGHNAKGTSARYLSAVGARLQQPASAEECFSRLMAGSADAVAMNEFTGRIVAKDMGISQAVELQLSRPLAIESLHAVAHKDNPQGQAVVDAFNDGLAAMRDSGEYLTVIDKHMSSIWAGL